MAIVPLVVDTGVHAKGWTRQQMVDSLHQHSTEDEPLIQAEVDRYIVMPGPALPLDARVDAWIAAQKAEVS